MAALTIVIPALNEEGAIGGTIERCLAAREQIKATAGLTEVEIIVVSDGSTDRTAEIARGFAGVKVIEFVTNRG
ncbi:MAG: glycosyltransferase, partial [Candidatus Rokuibacteriota bacterium]